MSINPSEAAARIVQDAGGSLIGRTRLQKTAYLLEAAGLGEGFQFEYKHYGPFSEDLADAAKFAGLLGLVEEQEQRASWGGFYSIYRAVSEIEGLHNPARQQLAREAASADAIELELAATALFLHREGCSDPWLETARRKPEKAEGGRIDRAKSLYSRLMQIDVPNPFPAIRH